MRKTSGVIDFGTADMENFRLSIREWLRQNPPPEQLTDEPLALYLRRWHRQLHAGGWVGLDVPTKYGGAGLSSIHQVILSDELGAANAPGIPRIGYLANALLHHGTEEQRATFIPRMLDATDVWCQGFSEPNAGSDLASMTTKASRNGDDYIIDGQKLWTSYAQYSNLCLLLARTSPDRHEGISAFALDLDTEGVTVRPLRASNGDDEFCEVFLDGVRVPSSRLLGEEGVGWPLAMTTVSYERSALDTGHIPKYSRVIDGLIDEIRTGRIPPSDGLETRIGGCLMRNSVLLAHARRRVGERRSGISAGAEMSIDKLLMTETEQLLFDTLIDLSRSDVLLNAKSSEFAEYLYSRAASVYGGATQIQLNILARQILGL